MAFFSDRVDAGKRLAAALKDFSSGNAVVLAIPRGGVVVGYEIAKALNLPLDVIIPRKIGAPDNPELAVGAVAEDGTAILNENLIAYLGVGREYIKEETERQKKEIERRLKLYRQASDYPNVKGLDAIVVDDGIATGSTMKAALASVRNRGAKSITVAIPVGAPSTIEELKKMADRVVCLYTPEFFQAIGQFYSDFSQTSDEEVIEMLNKSKQNFGPKPEGMVVGMIHDETELKIPVGKVEVAGTLTVPPGAKGIVVFAHGSGSGRFSPRNQYVAKEFNKATIGTLLFDLLTQEEEEQDMVTAEYRFNIRLLAIRLIGVTEWLRNSPQTKSFSFGYFGASTGAAAALIAAAKLPNKIAVVVSRGGRPDLAGEYLSGVVAPTLLLVGGLDTEVIQLNREAMDQMTAVKELVIIPGATHLFEEQGKLEEVAKLSIEWFRRYLT